MSRPGVRPFALIAAAVVIAGLAVAVWPQHGLSIVQLVTVTAAVVAGLHAVLVNVGSGTWDVRGSPLGRLARRTEAPTLPSDLERTHAQLHGTRYRYGNVALPWGTARQLRRIAAATLERRGIDMDDPSDHPAARTLVSPLTWAVLTPSPHKTRREHLITLPAHSPDVAKIVHLVLDDLDRLRVRASASEPAGGDLRVRASASEPAGGPETARPTRGSR